MDYTIRKEVQAHGETRIVQGQKGFQIIFEIMCLYQNPEVLSRVMRKYNSVTCSVTIEVRPRRDRKRRLKTLE